jgi:hypothetical protein
MYVKVYMSHFYKYVLEIIFDQSLVNLFPCWFRHVIFTSFTVKYEVIVIEGQVPIRSKVVVDNMEQVNMFIYLGCKISYQEEKDITSKISKIIQIWGILNNVFKQNLDQIQSQLKCVVF